MEAVDPRVRVADITVAKSGHTLFHLDVTIDGQVHRRKVSCASSRSKPADDYIRGNVRSVIRNLLGGNQ